MRAALLALVVAACSHGSIRSPARAPAVAATAVVAPAPVPPASPPAPAVPPLVASPASDISIEMLLAGAGELQALALVQESDDNDGRLVSVIISATPDRERAATCIRSASSTRCIEFAGYGRDHLVRALRDDSRPTVPVPTWATKLLADIERAPNVYQIDVIADEGGPLLMIHEDTGARFAVRRDRRWRLSSTKSGGKSSAPLYYGSLDTTRATTTPSIGLMIGHYSKESCVRSETIELVILTIDEALEDRGSTVIGLGAWVYNGDRFGLFDPKDPNHYRIQLRPRVQHDGRIRLELESRHTPRALRKRNEACGVGLALEEVDDLAKRIGTYSLDKLVTLPAADE